MENDWKIRVKIEKIERDNKEFKIAKVIRIKEVNGQVEEEELEHTLKDFKYETKREKILQFARDFLPVLKDTCGVARNLPVCALNQGVLLCPLRKVNM